MDSDSSGWATGWTAFAGLMMQMMGVWWGFAGFVAIASEDFYVVDVEWVTKFSATSWGWIHLILGIVVLFAGFGVFSGKLWARSVGIVIALVAALLAFAWLPYYPVWAILFITVSVFVIWALTVHGDDFADA